MKEKFDNMKKVAKTLGLAVAIIAIGYLIGSRDGYVPEASNQNPAMRDEVRTEVQLEVTQVAQKTDAEAPKDGVISFNNLRLDPSFE